MRFFDLLSMKHQIVLASRNQKKADEITALLALFRFQVLPVTSFPDVPEVEEDGQTFAENAAKKATQVARTLGRWAIGEDSGLCVDALDGEPGIYSARFSGDQATDPKNNALLLERMQAIESNKRQAHYVCYIVLSDPDGHVQGLSIGK